MKVWEIILPYRDNKGGSYANAHDLFQAHCLRVFGGFTAFDASGGWRDTETGGEPRDYVERVRVYRVLCEAEPGIPVELFPDQVAFYVGCIGEASINPASMYRTR